MRDHPIRLLALVTAALLAFTAPASAYKRLKWGPFELVPSMSLEIRQHSNVYVGSDSSQQRDDPYADVSGVIFDLRPGLSIVARPDLDKRIRGLYLDVKYQPVFILFPKANDLTPLCGSVFPFEPCDDTVGLAEHPDVFKIDHNVRVGLRLQRSGRFSVYTRVAYTHPELALTNVSLSDLNFGAGAKLDLTKTISIDGGGTFQRFEVPIARSEFVEDPSLPEPVRENSLTDAPFGSFDDIGGRASVGWRLMPTLTMSGEYRYSERTFVGLDFEPGSGGRFELPNNFNADAIRDNHKDYTQHVARLSASKRLTRQASGSASFGRLWRDNQLRQFGDSSYESWVGSATVETLLSRRTRLQASAEYTVTDTIREITFEDLNAFTTDQTGQFTVLPDQFSVAYDQRYMVDLVQNVFRRGDQILLGLAYQRDRLEDQIGTQNFFIPGTPFRRDLSDCTGASGDPTFCRPVLNDQTIRRYLLTAGYRFRFSGRLRFIGLQARGTYFMGTTETRFTEARQELVDQGLIPPFAATPPPDEDFSYWSVTGGLVLNLQVFQ